MVVWNWLSGDREFTPDKLYEHNVNFDKAFAVLEQSVQGGQIPGAVLGTISLSGSPCLRACGFAQLLPSAIPMQVDTVFDLASLTKVLFTTMHWLTLIEQGSYGLDDPISRVLPDLRQYDLQDWQRRITIKQLLSHDTLLPAVEPVYTLGLSAQNLRTYLLQHEWTPRAAPVYSDLNFWLLGIALERHFNKPLSALAQWAAGLTFTPRAQDCATTEFCHWRGRYLRGEVHDENAFALGGAAGHAGLFGNAQAVLEFARQLLAGESLPPSMSQQLQQRVTAHRTLGWEVWGDAGAGRVARIGHTGFTGVGLWLDWQKGVAWTLLTNRVHPSRHRDSGIVALRTAIAQALMQ